MTVRTWTGTTSNLWDLDANWGGTKPSAGDDLVFPVSASNKSNSNDFAADTSFNSITLDGSGYTLAGNGITLVAGIIQSVTSTNTISLAIILAADQTVDIQISTGTLTISGIISGAYNLAKTGTGKLTFGGVNTFSGGITIKAGSVNGQTSNNAFGSNTNVITLGNTSGSDNVILYGLGTTLNFPQPIVVASGSIGTKTIFGLSADFAGNITLYDNLYLNHNTSYGLFLGGIISESGGSYGLININTDAFSTYLAGANTFTGGLWIKSGAVYLSTASAGGGSGTGAITLGDTSGSANATLNIPGSVTYNNPITVASGSSGVLSVIFSLYSSVINGPIILNNNLLLNKATSYSPGVTGGITGTGNLTIQSTSIGTITLATTSVNHTGTITNSGTGTGTTVISAVIGTNVTGVIQNSATSQLTLSGANTFTSGLTIKAGTVSLITSTSAGGGSGTGTITIGDTSGSAAATLKGDGRTFANPIVLATGTTGVLTIQPSATSNIFSGGVTGTNNLTLNGSSAFTITLSTATVNHTGTITNLNAGTGTVTISSVIGTNVTGITQNSATSALTLSGINTYTGPIINSAGALNLTQDATFSTITLEANTTTNITAGKTITLTTLVSNGITGNLTILKSATDSAHFLTTASSQILIDYINLTNSQPVQANVWYTGANSIDSGNNGNWIFGVPGGGTDYNQFINNSIGVVDNFSKIAEFSRIIVNSFGLFDNLNRSIIYIRSQNDSVEMQDSLNQIISFFRVIFDSEGLTDETLVLVSLFISQIISDSIETVDGVGGVVNYIRELNDTEEIIDISTKMSIFLRTIIDSENITDNLQRILNYLRTLVDVEGLSDTMSRATIFAREIIDDEGLVDAISRATAFVRGIADEEGLSDEVNDILTGLITFLAAWYVAQRRNR